MFFSFGRDLLELIEDKFQVHILVWESAFGT